MQIAFYAPMKPPDHDVPSGDRKMARLLAKALETSGHHVELASRLRTWSRSPDLERLAVLRAQALAAADGFLGDVSAGRRRAPDLRFTYHNYYKAPDWIGARVAQALSIPYVAAEASLSSRRDTGPWSPWQADVRAQLHRANVIFALTRRDAAGLRAGAPDLSDRIVDLPPFLDIDSLQPERLSQPDPGVPLRLVTIAMMRPNNNLASYRALANALTRLPAGTPEWVLDVAGNGPADAEVRSTLSAAAGNRVRFHGRLDASGIAGLIRQGDLFAWPGVDEAFGVSYMEAAAHGLPAVAYDSGGVSDVVVHGRTGILVPPDDADGYAQALSDLMRDHDRRLRLGRQASDFVRGERNLATAAAILNGAVSSIVGKSSRGQV